MDNSGYPRRSHPSCNRCSDGRVVRIESGQYQRSARETAAQMRKDFSMKRYLSTFVAVLCTLLVASAVYSQDDPTVYVTRTGSKYHTAGCSYLRRSAIPMKLSE